ncbi:MAG: Ig-like domain-containing protein [Gammaproteobacteria bacterium]|nr:Ig-like domain-containing protein [Gammaproteobacteria bacterium]MBU1556409.1 Ig-like domain-containing protein [Gammaproteobacteria bacterium]MBU2072007.1 Ig-like domain-containing protein [Gammaproteobacteria bacterium]MBU2183908.1 Ig-like domain-containing protein [Gammaproteobacteria bacterium]MBU2203338.1 Ig-like domain-containing protein [Gammaproteobacteria bacterium]
MKIKPFINFQKLSFVAVLSISTLVTACGSDNNSDKLAKAVKLESERAKGTIIESVTIHGDSTRLKAGETHQLRASGVDSNNETRDITNELTWESSDTSIATVNNAGLVTAVANSDINQGIITITGTSINDISGEGEISVSDVAVKTISLKQVTPSSGNINTCIDAYISADVGYVDGYTSLNTTKDMSFSVDSDSSAVVTSDGALYTSAPQVESSTITARIGDIEGQLTVTADPVNLETLDVLFDDKVTRIITLNIGERINVNAQANLDPTVSTRQYQIDNSISWAQSDHRLIGITNSGENKGTILGLAQGVTTLIGSCGGKEAKATIEVKGQSTIDSIKINDGSDIITIAPSESIELILTANYSSTPGSINVSEFAQWNLNGSDLFDTELTGLGTDKASFKLTSSANNKGSAIISVIYDNIISSVRINIE